MRDNFNWHGIIHHLIDHSTSVAVVMMLITFVVCFSKNMFIYSACLSLSSVYLGILTWKYIKAQGNENKHCNRQKRCHVDYFNNRLSIVSNIVIAYLGLAFSFLIFYYIIKGEYDNEMYKIGLDVDELSLFTGMLKALFLYIIADKIHTLHLIMTIMIRYNKTIKSLNINLHKNDKKRYPVIYLDKKRISDDRYIVTAFKSVISVEFNPALSINDDSIIEYRLIEEDSEHTIIDKDIKEYYEQPACFFQRNISITKITDCSV